MERIGRYEIVRELGRGAMGVVYLANDPNIGRAVAIKTIRLAEVQKPDERERLRERLFREARSAGMLSHPGIVTIYDVDQQGDLAYIAMEFVDGPTLDEVLTQSAISADQMFSVLGQAAVALDYAHSKGIVHRDIKPANIMIAKDGTTKVTDFGIAKISANEHLTVTGTIVGTPHYMSPEQVQGLTVDGRSDQFSLAVIVYEMLTGEKPYTGEHLTTVVYKIVVEEPAAPPRLNPTLAGAIDGVLRKGLAKRPEDRFATCQEFSAALEKACNATRGWKTMARGGGLNEPTVVEAPFAAASLPPARPPRAESATVERSTRSTGFWSFLLAILVAGGLLALVGWQAAPWLAKNTQPKVQEPATPPVAPQAQTAQTDARLAAGLEAKSGDGTAANAVPAPPADSTPSPQAAAEPVRPVPAGEKVVEPAAEQAPTVALKKAALAVFPLAVVSSPGGATVTLDGRAEAACAAPCSLKATPGHHTVAVTMPGYQIEHRDVDIGSGPMELPAVILHPLAGTLMLTSQPAGASISVNGKKLPDLTPAQLALPPGNYNITLEKDGRQTTRPVEVRNGVINYMKVSLEP